MSNTLNDKQIKFCNEYLKDFNATNAAIRSGYSKKTAAVQASRLLTNVKVAYYLNSKREKVADKIDLSLDRLILEAGRIAVQDARQFFNEDGSLIPIHLLSDDAAAALAGMDVEEISEWVDGQKVAIGVTKKIKRYDKLKAIEMLMRYYGAFEKDNKQKEVKVITPLSDNQVKTIIEKLSGRASTTSKKS